MRKLYRLLGIIEHWVLRRFTPAGKLVLASIVISAVVGIDTKQSMAYQIFTFLVFLMAAAMSWGFFFKPRMEAARILPKFCSSASPLLYRITIENKTGSMQKDLSVMDDFYEIQYFPEDGQAVAAATPGGGFKASDGSLEKTLSRYARRGKFTMVPMADMDALSRCDVKVEITPRQRGRIYFISIQVACPDPLGLFRAIITIPARQSLVVLPRRYPLSDTSLAGTRKYQSGGVALASSIGDSGEFIGLREYRPGDPLRRIHWKSWAKVGKPIVKEYQDEFFVRHALVLDTFTPSKTSPAFEEAVSLAASFACAVDTQESLLDLMFVGLHSYCFTSGRGVGHVDRMLDILASVRTCRNKPFSELPSMVLEKSSALSSCICILLDWDETRKAFVERLRSIGVPVKALVVTDDKPTPGGLEIPESYVHLLEVGSIQEGLGRL